MSGRCHHLGPAGLLVANTIRPLKAEPPASNDPASIITAIYTRVAKGKGDGEAVPKVTAV